LQKHDSILKVIGASKIYITLLKTVLKNIFRVASCEFP